MPGGVAVFDYNGDGLPDLYFANGAEIPALKKTSPKYWNRLFRNEGNLRFTDVSETARVTGEGYANAVAVGDYDNDGHPDLFVAGVNRQTLFRNRGDGTFEDVTEKAGVASDTWAAAAGFFDYDRDGKLDLLVVRYSKTPFENRYCGDPARNLRVYCNPKYFEPLAPKLYRNRGDGTFQDVSEASGLAKYPCRGMSVVFADYDDDGYPDIFIGNDNMPNFLFHNKGNGAFEEVGLAAGVALGDRGQPVAGMGSDFRDYDNDGRPDVLLTALAGETFPLFRNLGKGSFADVTYSIRVGQWSSQHSGWGVSLVDFDNDGWKDIFTANAHVNDRVEQFEAHVYKEPNRVARNLSGKFVDATPRAMLDRVAAHRGAAIADFDNDGGMDIAVSTLGGPAELWRNVTPGAGNWLAFRLQGTRSNRDGIGARIHLDGQWNEMTSSVSYASASLVPVHFGVGSATSVARVEIRWPSGRTQVLRNLPVNRVMDVKEPGP